MKKTLFFSLLVAPGLLFFCTFLFFSTRVIHLLDFIFYIGLILLLIGSVLLILQSGFFNAFILTSKHFFSTISKREQAIQLFEGENSGKVRFQKEYPILKNILLLGFVYFSFSLIASIALVYL